MFFKKLVDKKNDKAKFDIIIKTNEKNISVNYGCIRFIHSYRFSSINLDGLVRNLNEIDFKILRKKEFPDKLHYLNKKLAYTYEYFNSIDDYQKRVDNLKKEDFFSKLKTKALMMKSYKEQKKLLKDLIIKTEKN